MQHLVMRSGHEDVASRVDARPGAPRQVRRPERRREQRRPGAFRILVVDDEPDLLESVATLLSRYFPDAHVRTAADGAAAAVELDHASWDLVVTDYRMPGMDGLELLAHLQQVAPGTDAIMMTAFPDPGLQRKAQGELGVRAFVPKPFNVPDLVDRIREIRDD